MLCVSTSWFQSLSAPACASRWRPGVHLTPDATRDASRGQNAPICRQWSFSAVNQCQVGGVFFVCVSCASGMTDTRILWFRAIAHCLVDVQSTQFSGFMVHTLYSPHSVFYFEMVRNLGSGPAFEPSVPSIPSETEPFSP